MCFVTLTCVLPADSVVPDADGSLQAAGEHPHLALGTVGVAVQAAHRVSAILWGAVKVAVAPGQTLLFHAARTVEALEACAGCHCSIYLGF